MLYTFFTCSNGGTTLYVGSRASDQYGRFYDKGKERDPKSLAGMEWRYEVEFKGKRAARVLEVMKQEVARGDVEQAIGATVYKWFAGREVTPIYARNGKPLAMDVKAELTSDEVKLLWLTKQVRPSIRRLVEHGKLDQVMDALELDWHNPVMIEAMKRFKH